MEGTYAGPTVSAVARLTAYSLFPSRLSTECDHCAVVLATRADLWHFGGRIELCAACRDEVVADPDPTLGPIPLDDLSICEPFPRDAGHHGPKPRRWVLDLSDFASGRHA